VSVYPEGAQKKDDQDMLPLHLACRNGASKGVVLTLLNVYPDALDSVDRKGRTPMELIQASNSQNKEIVLAALNKFKRDQSVTDVSKSMHFDSLANNSALSNYSNTASAVTEVDYQNRTILFKLIIKKDWSAVAQRSASHAVETRTWIVTKGFHGNLRFLPLHKACVLQPPSTVLQNLITAYPEGAKSKDQDGWLPVHCACFYGASEEVIETLLLSNPSGAHSKDDEGRMPLHYASLKAADEGTVAALLRSNPKAAMSKDDEGRLPIHHACSKGSSEGCIEALLKVSPKGAQSKDDQGRLPLHHACRKGAGERVVRALLRFYPRGAQVKDDQEKLPIHYACQNGVKEGVVSLLMNTYPESVNSKNGFGYTPMAEAQAMSNVAIVSLIEKFKAQHDLQETGTSSSSKVKIQSTVTELTERVNYLESLLTEVAQIGTELSTETKDKKGGKGTAVHKLANRLASIKPVGR